MIGSLTQKEWDELVALDYVLTFNYSEYTERDLKRQQELRKKRWSE